MFELFESFQPKDILILFLFSMKQSDLLMVKITVNINNSPKLKRDWEDRIFQYYYW